MVSRKYELMYIAHPDLGSEEVQELIDRYREMTEELGGEVENVDDWGVRRLAYEIDELREGYYVVMEFRGDQEITEELQRRLRLNDNVIRLMIIRDDEG